MMTTVCMTMVAALVVSTSWAAMENRTMSECYEGGVKCSRWAKCYFNTAAMNFTCSCVMGYKGDLCTEDVNECERGSAPCLKRGVCHNFMGGFRCDCLPGWYGTHCQHSDASGLSTCLTGYTGVNCTDDFDECTQWTESPCEHGSTCVNTPGNFSCSCVTGWEGRICDQDINECNLTTGLCHNNLSDCRIENPCEHGSSCVNTPGNFSCRCATGWEGLICNHDINECNLTTGLCHNGGNCTNIPGSYKCVCPYPYTGAACDDVYSTTLSTTTFTRPSISSTTTSTTAAIPPSGKSSNDGVPTVWIITGSCIGLVVVVFGVGAVLLLYKRYHRKGRQVDAGDKGVVEGPQN